MLHISRWKAFAIVATTLLICLLAVPNLLSPSTVKDWPKWAQRHVVLGLDLQGGSHILLEVDTAAVRKEKVEQLRDEVRKVLREAKVGLTQAPLVRGDSVEVRIRPADLQQGLTKLRELSQPLGGLLSATGQRTIDIVSPGDGLVRLTWTEPAILERIRQAVDQSIQVVTRRVDELGTVEPVIQRQGVDRILIQVPGLDDPKRLLEIIGRTAKLDFRMVDQNMTAEQALATRPPPESEVLYGTKAEGGRAYLIEKRVVVSGGDLVDAQPAFDQRTNEPVVSMRFNASGARRWAQATTENVGRLFAIILDNEVISAPVIREPIIGGQSQISGSFTVQSANDLAILLRAGALPAKLTVIEQRVVGAGLGQDSIEKGTTAAYYGAILVAVYMLAAYGIFGVFAVIAVGFQRRDDFRRPVAHQRDADAARDHRYRAHDRHCGGFQRADLRAHPRGDADRPQRDLRDRCRVHPCALDDPGLQHHDLHRRSGAVLHRHRAGAGLRRDVRHWHHHHRIHRLHADTPDGLVLGALVSSATSCGHIRRQDRALSPLSTASAASPR